MALRAVNKSRIYILRFLKVLTVQNSLIRLFSTFKKYVIVNQLALLQKLQ